eukprot:278215_1
MAQKRIHEREQAQRHRIAPQLTTWDKQLQNSINSDRLTMNNIIFFGISEETTLFKECCTIELLQSRGLQFIEHIHSQIIERMKWIIESTEVSANKDEYLNLFDGISNEVINAISVLMAHHQHMLNTETAAAVKTLWNEPTIKQIYEQRARSDDNTSYFWDRIDDIVRSEYVPSNKDIQLVQYKHGKIIDEQFDIETITFHGFVNVGLD